MKRKPEILGEGQKELKAWWATTGLGLWWEAAGRHLSGVEENKND